MTPEREAQMREMFQKKYGKRPTNDPLLEATWDDRKRVWDYCLNSLEPMVRDGERLRAYCMTRNPENDALLQIELRILNGEIPTMDEWRIAIDVAVGAALEDGNATE